MPELTIRPSIGADEYPALVAIWRRAVDATHGFVHESHRDEIEAHLASEYLPSVALSVAEIGGLPVGFAGTLDGNLEMLFVDAARRGDGIGSALLAHVVRHQDVSRVDVNEQNAAAVAFYGRRGFVVAGRSEVDEAGRPYPLLHLRLSQVQPSASTAAKPRHR